jgi:hypothetical protein
VDRVFTNKKTDSIHLKVAITEPILLACIDGASLLEIHLRVYKTIPTTERIIRNYLFHLINSFLVSYKGIMKMYFVTPRGLDILEIIYFQRKRGIANYTDFVLKIE